jgi:hypothetical protein
MLGEYLEFRVRKKVTVGENFIMRNFIFRTVHQMGGAYRPPHTEEMRISTET